MSTINDAILRGISGLRWSVIGKVDYGSSLWVLQYSVSVAFKGNSFVPTRMPLVDKCMKVSCFRSLEINIKIACNRS